VNYVVQKTGEGSYKVKDKYSGATKAERRSHAEAQRLASRLDRLRLSGVANPSVELASA
jgi:hypothetical protein